MISLKRYLDGLKSGDGNSDVAGSGEQESTDVNIAGESPEDSSSDSASAQRLRKPSILPLALSAYRSTLKEMGSCSHDACPTVSEELREALDQVVRRLSKEVTAKELFEAEKAAREQLREWAKRATNHNLEKTREVKEILLVMANATESVGERDQRCARQLNDVTTRLKKIANLEDLSQIRALIEESAAELKTSIDRMTAEGKAAIDQLKSEVSTYQCKLQQAEDLSARDALTGLRSRLRMETELKRQMERGEPFCVAIVDIDGFKQVNDDYGHLIGDELLKQFAAELQSASRGTDVIGRWGGDEFIILLECNAAKASTQAARMREWICGNYTVEGTSGARKLRVEASIGLAERRAGESLKSLIDRADADMYKQKAAARKNSLSKH